MASKKPVLNPNRVRGSFGGQNQLSSVTQNQRFGLGSTRSRYADSEKSTGGPPSPTLASIEVLFNDEEFPALGRGSTSSPAAARNPRTDPLKSSRRGSAAEAFPKVQTGVTDSPLPTLASATQSLNNEEFPDLGGTSTSSSAETGNPRKVSQKSSRRGSAAKAFPEDTDDPLQKLASAMNDEEFPALGGAITSSRTTAAGNPRNPRMDLQETNRRGSAAEVFPIVKTEDTVSTSSSVMGFQKIHHRARREDDWPHRASAQGNRNGSARGQPGVAKKKPYVKNRDDIDFLGRLLSGILRHRAVDLNLQIRDDGYIVVNDLLKLGIETSAGLPLSVYTVDDVLKAVERDNKQRFGLLRENGVLLIRANQGHSIKFIESDKLLKPILSPDEIPVCVHGTSMRNLELILETGLKKMERNHVHFASGLPKEDGVISGMRLTSEVLIYLDSKKALEDEMKLYMSDNGVILTEGFNGVVPPKYFAQVATWSKGQIVPYPFDAKA